MEAHQLIDQIRGNLVKVQTKITEAALSVGRNPNEIQLVVVTKGQPMAVMHAAAEAGAIIFGENYVQETEEKKVGFSIADRLSWHMIGHIQSRKAEAVARLYDMVHSVDSLKLARKLDLQARMMGRILPALIEVNIGGEESKSGIGILDGTNLSDAARLIADFFAFKNLRISGLMTMPPLFNDVEKVRPKFRQLRELRDTVTMIYPGCDFSDLSMGTSMDFEIAVQEGATYVRIGQAILGTQINK